jgi:hypothetical protein
MTDAPGVQPLDVLGAGAGGPLPPASPWFDYGSYIQYNRGVVIGSGVGGGGMGNATINVGGYFLNGQPFDFTSVVALDGRTAMTGLLTLSGNPVNNLQAATKQYVDSSVAVAGNGRFLALSGGTMTGTITLAADPTLPLASATKQYVDGRTPITTDAPNNTNYYVRYQGTWAVMPAGITIADAPADGTTYARNNNAWTNIFDAGTF